MMMPAKTFLFFSMAVLVLLALLLPGKLVQARTPNTHFLLFYSNDVRAELEPCG